ncbi:MAG: hypothetical protein SO014_08390 [Candidatus Limivicinus sp.]|nr:hypothetical protein [Candidatus Limivicinus sp.]
MARAMQLRLHCLGYAFMIACPRPHAPAGRAKFKCGEREINMFCNSCNNSGLWLIILIIILFGGGCGCGCGNSCGCDNNNNGCGCGC